MSELSHSGADRSPVGVSLQVVPRPEPPQYTAFFLEVSMFLATSASVDRVRSLAQKLSRGPDGSGRDLAAQEAATWQETTLQFIKRLGQKYPLYRDVVQPVQLAAYEMAYGTNVMLSQRAQLARGPHQNTLKVLTHTQSQISHQAIHNRTQPYFSHSPEKSFDSSSNYSQFRV